MMKLKLFEPFLFLSLMLGVVVATDNAHQPLQQRHDSLDSFDLLKDDAINEDTSRVSNASLNKKSTLGQSLANQTEIDTLAKFSSDAAKDCQNVFRTLCRLGDYLYHLNTATGWSNAFAVYESAFHIRAMAREVIDETIIPSADDFILYALACEKMHKEELAEKAIAVLEEGLLFYPSSFLIHHNLGVYFHMIDTERQEMALNEIQWVLDNHDELNSWCLYNRAIVLMHRDWEAAAQSLEPAIGKALEQDGKAWYENTPWLIRQHGHHLKNVTAIPSRIMHLKAFAEEAFPLLLESKEDMEPLVLEFGVAEGESIAYISQYISQRFPDQLVYGFDSFVGLPEDWAMDKTGEYSQVGVAPTPLVPQNVRFEAGWFNETLPRFLEQHPGPVAALHLDADLYTSTIEVLEMLVHRIGPGCIIRFDELYLLRAFGTSIKEDYDQYEARAWKEFTTKYNIEARPLNWHGQSVTFVVDSNEMFVVTGS